MDDPRESPWSYFDLNDHITDLRQDDPRTLPRRRELWAFAVSSSGIEEANLHLQSVFAHLAPMVVPALHLYTCHMELTAREGVDPFHTLLHMMGVALPRWFISMFWQGTT